MKRLLQKLINPLLIILLILFITFIIIVNIHSILESYNSFSIWLFPKNDNRNGELFKIILSILGALGILFGLYVSLRRAKAIESGVKIQSDTINIQSDQIELSRKSQVDERFKNAIEHLGSDKEPIILGGIAELHQIARENQNNYSEIVFNILTSYIRSNSNLNNSQTIIQTIMNSLFLDTETNPYFGYKADLSRTNLIGIDLSNKNICKADLSYSKFSKCSKTDLSGSDLSNSIFFFSRLKKVNFNSCKLYKTLFFGGGIENCEFSLNCDFPTADFVDVDINNSNFNAQISDWNFVLCDIKNTCFSDSEIFSTKFCLNNFKNVSFSNIESFSRNDFRGSYFENTKINNSSIFLTNFNGVRISDEFTISQIDSISRLLKHKTNLEGIEFINCSEYKNSYDQLTQDDLDEIIKYYDKCRERTFKKDK